MTRAWHGGFTTGIEADPLHAVSMMMMIMTTGGCRGSVVNRARRGSTTIAGRGERDIARCRVASRLTPGIRGGRSAGRVKCGATLGNTGTLGWSLFTACKGRDGVMIQNSFTFFLYLSS